MSILADLQREHFKSKRHFRDKTFLKDIETISVDMHACRFMPSADMGVCNVMLIAHSHHPKKFKVQTVCPSSHLSPQTVGAHGLSFIHVQKDMIITMAPWQVATSQLNHSGEYLLGI